MSFYTSLTGLNAATAQLSVTSNNIANVGTTGFKRCCPSVMGATSRWSCGAIQKAAPARRGSFTRTCCMPAGIRWPRRCAVP